MYSITDALGIHNTLQPPFISGLTNDMLHLVESPAVLAYQNLKLRVLECPGITLRVLVMLQAKLKATWG